MTNGCRTSVMGVNASTFRISFELRHSSFVIRGTRRRASNLHWTAA